ncbi:MAG: photosynthetic complex putative assembly protein PuhB [Aestuariivita sp.]|nr:photosynthetic complex putative assembly protein PuhB [Aestuariivita sp.]MCY4203950.1 photosynthetic complex putative assembly protein PuhB [Aestuariivita sp.]MCY4290111.1 photosynthetic complex putative assembly protein PuhB [Aestuariivita sp.]MCY4346487.1 photosynthetic complex putative assembly protein PuhB [Aestuariivita sp.]
MAHKEYDFEPIKGLPETLPVGEEILWQGRPDWWMLSWQSLSLPWVLGYFLVLASWRFIAVIDQIPLGQAVGATLPFLFLAATVFVLLLVVGYIQARASLYTITNRRVVMRIGAALTLTLNVPYTQIAAASLCLDRRGTGTIAFETMGATRLGYIVCWPHVRPWHLKRVQPALRAIPNALEVSDLLSKAANSQVRVARSSASRSSSVQMVAHSRILAAE